MRGRRAVRATPPAGWVALAAALLAVGAGLWLVFLPVYQGVSETVSSSGAVTGSSDSATLIDQNGSWVVFPLCIPVILAALGFFATKRESRVLAWVLAAALCGFVLLTGFSIGLFFAPAAGALLLAAILTDSAKTRSSRGERVS